MMDFFQAIFLFMVGLNVLAGIFVLWLLKKITDKL